LYKISEELKPGGNSKSEKQLLLLNSSKWQRVLLGSFADTSSYPKESLASDSAGKILVSGVEERIWACNA